MISARLTEGEDERLKDLNSYRILDTLPEEDYDNLTRIAAQICGTKISLVSLVDQDRQWFKSHHGIDATETPRDVAFCAHAIHNPDEVFVVEDARKDDRFFDNPLTTGDAQVVFYAGVPLKQENGRALGTLCVIDGQPKQLNASQLDALKTLANQTMRLLELRLNKMALEQNLQDLNDKNQSLQRFAYTAAHDIKSPLTNISGLATVLVEDYGETLDDDQQKIIGMMNVACDKLESLVNNLLTYSDTESILNEAKQEIDLDNLAAELKSILVMDQKTDLRFESDLKYITARKTALDQILINLIANAIKYSDKDAPVIKVTVKEDEQFYHINVEDNGPGIPKDKEELAFEMFKTLKTKDRFGRQGNGMGLATISRIIQDLGGSITLKNQGSLGGASFMVTLTKL